MAGCSNPHDTTKQSKLEDSEEWAESTLRIIEAAAGYGDSEKSNSEASSLQSYATAKEWQSDEDGTPKTATSHDAHRVGEQHPAELREPSPTPSLTPSDILHFNTIPRGKSRKVKGKGVVEEEISDMPVSDDEKDSDEQFEEIYRGGYGSSEHNGTRRKWWKEFRR